MSERTLRIVVALLGLYHLLTGLLALFAPGTFFDEIGRYGAENPHYVGDVGAFTAAYGVILLAAVRCPSWWTPVLLVGAAWYAAHAFNHLLDIDEARSDARGTLDTILLAFGSAALSWLAVAASRLKPQPARKRS